MNSSATNSGGYGSSVMRNTTLPEIKTTLPQEWQDVIKSVKKYASTGPNSYDGITSLNLDLFLLSEIELYGKKNLANNYDNEGSVYEYWKGRVDSDRAKTYGSSNSKTHWWLRSCQQNNNGCFCSAWDTGIPTADPANQTFGVSFAFCV